MTRWTGATLELNNGRALPRLTILISGAPGSGKSTMARPMAQALGFALLSKDAIKEALFDAFGGSAGDEAHSKRLSDAAMAVLFALAAYCPRVVLDANFRPRDAEQRARLAALGGAMVEVHCRCPPEEAARRFAQRAEARHPAHALKRLTPEMLAQYDRPVGIGPVIEVDTRTPVDLPALLRRVSDALKA